MYAVDATFNPNADDGTSWDSTGISFDDFFRMRTVSRARAAYRQDKAAPSWSLNNELLAAVICRTLESRAGFRRPRPGTIQERLARAESAVKNKNARKMEILDHLLLRHKVARAGGLIDDAEKISRKVEEYDSQIIVNQKIALLYAGLVYYYFRCGLDSVGVSIELQNNLHVPAKPPWVRQQIHRLRCTAIELGYEPATVTRASIAATNVPSRVAARIAKMRSAGKTWDQIKKQLNDPKPHNHHLRKLLVQFGHLSTCRVRAKHTRKINIEDAARLRRQGFSVTQIARALGCTRAAAFYALDRAGVPRQHPTKLDDEKVLEMYRGGASYREIAEVFGVTAAAAWYSVARAERKQKTGSSNTRLSSVGQN